MLRRLKGTLDIAWKQALKSVGLSIMLRHSVWLVSSVWLIDRKICWYWARLRFACWYCGRSVVEDWLFWQRLHGSVILIRVACAVKSLYLGVSSFLLMLWVVSSWLSFRPIMSWVLCVMYYWAVSWRAWCVWILMQSMRSTCCANNAWIEVCLLMHSIFVDQLKLSVGLWRVGLDGSLVFCFNTWLQRYLPHEVFILSYSINMILESNC